MQLFDEYNPVNDDIFRIIDNEGKIINKKWKPELDNATIIKAYKDMLFARTADMMAVSFQRQGRMFTYPPNYGQEAISVACAMVMRNEDWLVPAFRELAAWLAKGASLKDVFMYFMGYEEGTAFRNANHIVPISVPIASQFTHAAGIGYEINYNKKDEVVYAFVGDGGTSEGDFHEALNFAAVWKAPVVFVVQNNQFAISVPFSKQTASKNIAIKALAYGMPGIKVDGNDIFALYRTFKEVSDYARQGKGPVLIEALTYRKGAHTTSDDPTKYRTKEEEELWDKTDPLKRLKLYLTKNKLWSEEEEKALLIQYKKEVDRQFEEAENYPPYKLEDVFKYLYVDMPDDLKRQKVEYENFLNWKENEKVKVKI
ncbi:MAG: pyruvate dehydrogenase (acetyl-transferring) E1 component subunit alpha [Bacteroidales bacterium]|nr:pyruvate dehydrogenase (acetyl-transferring) E1 component subunit alpha [Bacteroidales bacterium]